MWIIPNQYLYFWSIFKSWVTRKDHTQHLKMIQCHKCKSQNQDKVQKSIQWSVAILGKPLWQSLLRHEKHTLYFEQMYQKCFNLSFCQWKLKMNTKN